MTIKKSTFKRNKVSEKSKQEFFTELNEVIARGLFACEGVFRFIFYH